MRKLSLLITLLASLAYTPAKADDVSQILAYAQMSPAQKFWETLREFELAALNDYRNRNTSPVVLNRSNRIWELQLTADLGDEFIICRKAARNLSYMVSSTYFDAMQGRLPVDWFHLSDVYEEQRDECISTVGLDDGNYPLPWWFGM